MKFSKWQSHSKRCFSLNLIGEVSVYMNVMALSSEVTKDYVLSGRGTTDYGGWVE